MLEFCEGLRIDGQAVPLSSQPNPARRCCIDYKASVGGDAHDGQNLSDRRVKSLTVS